MGVVLQGCLAHLPAARQVPGGDSRLETLVGLFSSQTFNDEKFICLAPFSLSGPGRSDRIFTLL